MSSSDVSKGINKVGFILGTEKIYAQETEQNGILWTTGFYQRIFAGIFQG